MDQPPEPVRSATAALRAELKKSGSLALLFMATLLSVVSALSFPEVKLPMVWPLTILVLWVSYVWISSGALREQVSIVIQREQRILDLESQPNLQMPKVVRAVVDSSGEGGLILLLKPNKLFGQSMLISIYFEDERGLELLVGSGSVSNIQMNGFIQIAVREWQEPHNAIRQNLIEQNQDAFDRIMIKPASNTMANAADLNAAILGIFMNRAGGEQHI